jgi:hypothetical protein
MIILLIDKFLFKMNTDLGYIKKYQMNSNKRTKFYYKS